MSGEFKLYGRIGSGSAACEAILALTGLPHTLIDLARWERGKPPAELLAVNPLGQIPALVLPHGGVITESAAICLYLADLASESGLAPLITHKTRAPYLRWMVYLAANSYATALRFYYPDRYTSAAGDAEAVKQAALQRDKLEWAVVAGALQDAAFLLGHKMSAADIYAAMLLSWQLDLTETFKTFPRLERLYSAVAAHQKIAATWQRHEMAVPV